MVESSSKIRIWGPKSPSVRSPGIACAALIGANLVSQKMCRLVVGSHHTCDANWVGSSFTGVLEQRWKIRGRPQKVVEWRGNQTICTVRGGHGQGKWDKSLNAM